MRTAGADGTRSSPWGRRAVHLALAWGYRGCSEIASGSEQPTLLQLRQWRSKERFLAVGIWGRLGSMDGNRRTRKEERLGCKPT